MRRYLLYDIMERKEMSTKDVVENSDGLLTYKMVTSQLAGRNKITTDDHIKGWRKALSLSDDELIKIFFD